MSRTPITNRLEGPFTTRIEEEGENVTPKMDF